MDILFKDADQQQQSSSDRYSVQSLPACFGDIKINRREGTIKFHCSVMRETASFTNSQSAAHCRILLHCLLLAGEKEPLVLELNPS